MTQVYGHWSWSQTGYCTRCNLRQHVKPVDWGKAGGPKCKACGGRLEQPDEYRARVPRAERKQPKPPKPIKVPRVLSVTRRELAQRLFERIIAAKIVANEEVDAKMRKLIAHGCIQSTQDFDEAAKMYEGLDDE